MTNGNRYYSFIHFLKETGEFNEAKANCFRHTGDMMMKELLVEMGLMTDEHANYLWQQYIRGKVNVFLKETGL